MDKALEIFEEICKIPHISKHEAKLRQAIIDFFSTREHFGSEVDSYGNLRIFRTFPLVKDKKKIVLQAHLDMVPQSLDANFDFLNKSIETKIEGNFLLSKQGTTLGADNGIGVASAMSILLDPELKNYNLEAIFTIEEEIGLNGAMNLDSRFLDNAEVLLNLDSEDWGELYIGCAGGVRLDTTIDIAEVDSNPQYSGIKLELKNLQGGHSGTDINRSRGNAIIGLLNFIKNNNLEISSIKGGTLDNAIVRECEAIVSSPVDSATLQSKAKAFVDNFEAHFSDECGVELLVTPCPNPVQIWQNNLAIVETLINTPNGVIESLATLNVVKTSTNLAIIRYENQKLSITTSQRSLSNSKRDELSTQITEHFGKIKGKSARRSEYPGWEADESSKLLEIAKELYCNMFNSKALVKVIHAGLECGILRDKNSQMEMLSFGPTIKYPHSPSERLDLESLTKFYQYLVKLIQKID